ncbi:right-handed parallel beta-helix repeat-containing protein [Pseudomonas sp. HD6515]|uniref:right-handed parallel beta-helix repeat-containing protein n=1 Tax=Pseudomonas sp. HD6515 TaxID=2856556 RepID=UPI00217D57E1|nr:right-handed parallel beta-helix repeat-containing protein [Pseudomonas sp. HD6515]UWH21566.1 right-handed parallel beta-helix repeat-containing protein [Pseudomonas sp. HD6515]
MNSCKIVSKFLLVGVVTALSQGCQSVWAEESGKLCELPNNGVLSGNVRLDGSCVYNQTITINKSNVEVDCNGATLDGQGEKKYGVLINSKGRPLSDVSVSNCNVRDFLAQGVLVTSGVPDARRSSDRDLNYSISPTRITLKNLVVERSGGVGVFLHSYVTDVTLSGSKILDTKGVGIYLEHSSRDNKLIGNIIRNNGAWNGPKTGQREGLAIDSSARNLIEGNKFIGNSAGGIFLYKNCGERFSQGRSVIRWQSSNDNIIKNNKFYDEKVGIWVASRQSRNQKKSDCGDRPLDSEGKYFADYANHNAIQGNEFCRNKLPIKVEGDDNIITGNYSDIKTQKWVSQPETMKARLTGVQTSGNIIANNSFEACGGE